jgi:hypothetical protein
MKKLPLIIEVPPITDSSLSITKKLEAYLPEIDSYLAQGISRATIIEHLNRIGFNLTLATFATMLKRIRKRQRTSNGKQPSIRRASFDRSHPASAQGKDPYRDRPRKFEYDPKKPIGDW